MRADLERALLVEADEGADAPVPLADRAEAPLDRLDRGDRPRPDGRREAGQALLTHRAARLASRLEGGDEARRLLGQRELPCQPLDDARPCSPAPPAAAAARS